MKIEEYFLDLKSMESLDNRNKEFIHNYYRDMVTAYCDNRIGIAASYFNTLIKSGYLKNIKVEERDQKIEQLL